MKQITPAKLKALLSEPESEHLDFKQAFSTNVDIVKDILALANSRTRKKDRFLIFGISDKDKQICGVENTENRKNQADIIDLLFNKINKMPKLKLYTLMAEGHEIDVLHIENTAEQPYLLKVDVSAPKCAKTCPAGTFYERVGDTNRPIIEDAILDTIYRQRFGLDKTPLEKAHIYLKNIKGWKCDYDENMQLYFYYKQFPEFTIQVRDQNEEFNGPWAIHFPDKRATQDKLFLKYHGTILQTFIGVWSDGARYFTIVPEMFFHEAKESGGDYLAFYYIKNSIKFYLNEVIQKVYPSQQMRITFPLFATSKHAEKMFKKNWDKYPHFRPEEGVYKPKNRAKLTQTAPLRTKKNF